MMRYYTILFLCFFVQKTYVGDKPVFLKERLPSKKDCINIEKEYVNKKLPNIENNDKKEDACLLILNKNMEERKLWKFLMGKQKKEQERLGGLFKKSNFNELVRFVCAAVIKKRGFGGGILIDEVEKGVIEKLKDEECKWIESKEENYYIPNVPGLSKEEMEKVLKSLESEGENEQENELVNRERSASY